MYSDSYITFGQEFKNYSVFELYKYLNDRYGVDKVTSNPLRLYTKHGTYLV